MCSNHQGEPIPSDIRWDVSGGINLKSGTEVRSIEYQYNSISHHSIHKLIVAGECCVAYPGAEVPHRPLKIRLQCTSFIN
nr:hypothetical protein Iba_chr14cCG6080 [Ipomoea batatas]